MIRRTIALAGATALALGVIGLSGPAAADDSVGIASIPDATFNEFGAGLDANLLDVNGIELLNTTSSVLELENWTVSACSPTGMLTEIATLGPNDEILANGLFVIGDSNFDTSFPGRADLIDSDLMILGQSAGGLQLVDDASPANVHSISWGGPDDTTCDSFPDVLTTPTDDETVQFDGTSWCRSAETFGSANTANC